MLRQLRILSPREVGVQAAQLKTLLARAMIALDADTTYTHAIAAREKVGLSHRNALDADSLLHMVERRRDAGDASDMDVELARVNAGQQANIATADSLTVISSLLDLQAILGYSVDRLEVQAVDSLGTPPTSIAPASTTLSESAAQLSLQSADLNARLQHRSIWQQFSVSVGLEHGDPSQPGILPTFGIGLGLPIFDRNRGPIATAEAERLRAQAELTLAQGLKRAIERLRGQFASGRERVVQGDARSHSLRECEPRRGDVSHCLSRRRFIAHERARSRTERARHSFAVCRRSCKCVDRNGRTACVLSHSVDPGSMRRRARTWRGDASLPFIVLLTLLGACAKKDAGDETVKAVVNAQTIVVTASAFTETLGAIGIVVPRAGHIATPGAPAQGRVAQVGGDDRPKPSSGACRRRRAGSCALRGCAAERGDVARCS